jgi:L-seryl-tRNA(Ser) seleniumtransferase
MTTDPRRALPNMDVLLGHPELVARAASFGREVVLGAARRALEESRGAVAGGGPAPDVGELAARVAGELDGVWAKRTRAVVNATGVVLHTNLGRAPLSAAARQAVAEAAGYAAVEYDLAAGARGRRGAAAEALLREATGAEAALVANNAAGGRCSPPGAPPRAGRGLLGESIEIGGVPAPADHGGGRVVPRRSAPPTGRTCATTRRARRRDRMVLVVHPSNYVRVATRPALAELAALASEHLCRCSTTSARAGTASRDEPSWCGSLRAGPTWCCSPATARRPAGQPLVAGPS